MLHQLRGDPAAVREFAAEALAVSVEHRFAFWQAGATVLLGWAAAASAPPFENARGGSRAADGVSVLEQGIEAWRATGSVTYRTYSLSLLADARWRCGRPGESLEALNEAERVMAETGERLWEPEIHRIRGELLRGLSPDSAEAAFRAAVAAAEGQGAPTLRLRAAVGLGRLLRDRGRRDEAVAVVLAAFTPAGGLGETPEMVEAKDFLRT
jgi:predicted ATPase